MRLRRWIHRVLLPLFSIASATTAYADDPAAVVREHAGAHRLLVLGEYHGTREIPLLVQQLVQHYSRDGAPMVLALEMPRGENRALARHLASSGDDRAQAALRARTFWNVRDDQHDGRRSRDMLALIEAVRALVAEGRNVQVRGYDINVTGDDAQARDDAMARELRSVYQAMPRDGRLPELSVATLAD